MNVDPSLVLAAAPSSPQAHITMALQKATSYKKAFVSKANRPLNNRFGVGVLKRTGLNRCCREVGGLQMNKFEQVGGCHVVRKEGCHWSRCPHVVVGRDFSTPVNKQTNTTEKLPSRKTTYADSKNPGAS